MKMKCNNCGFERDRYAGEFIAVHAPTFLHYHAGKQFYFCGDRCLLDFWNAEVAKHGEYLAPGALRYEGREALDTQ